MIDTEITDMVMNDTMIDTPTKPNAAVTFADLASFKEEIRSEFGHRIKWELDNYRCKGGICTLDHKAVQVDASASFERESNPKDVVYQSSADRTRKHSKSVPSCLIYYRQIG